MSEYGSSSGEMPNRKSAQPNPEDESPDISHINLEATSKYLGYVSAFEGLLARAKRQIANPKPPSTSAIWAGYLIETQRPPINQPKKPISRYDVVLFIARLETVEKYKQRPVEVPMDTMAERQKFDQDLERWEVRPVPTTLADVDQQEMDEFMTAVPAQESWPTIE